MVPAYISSTNAAVVEVEELYVDSDKIMSAESGNSEVLRAYV